jgi:hypothetical protein
VVTNGRDVEVWTTILHVSGQYRTDGPLAFNGGSNPQQAGSAITYARRYALSALLGVLAEDDDGESAQGRGKAAAQSNGHGPAAPSGEAIASVADGSRARIRRAVARLFDSMRRELSAAGSKEGRSSG